MDDFQNDAARRLAGLSPNRRQVLKGSMIAGIAAGSGLFAGSAEALDAFPSKPITILVPWGPGGGPSQISDAVAKISAQAKYLSQPMTLDHRPGASGLIGTALVSDRKGDPYVFMPGGGALLLQAVLGESPVDPLTGLTPLALSTLDSSVVIAAANSPYNTLADVTAELKKKPRSVTMAGAGGSGWDSVVANTLGAAAGVEFNQIPFASGAEVQAAVLGGQVAVGSRQLSNAQELISAGQIKALAIFDAERNPSLPDVPTMKELGYDVVLNLARGWFGPPGLKDEEVQWYGELFKKLSTNGTWVDYVQKSGSQNKYLGPAEWRGFIQQTMQTIQRIYKQIGLIK
ncbi:tripartite tricarboxylate transporter substrate-binding protein [Mesorhizobium sp. B2-2-1]|nr:tripartite tricarboxylate transporter substrate-binding protein [Mesorhizobium sp. B2-2-1]